MALRCLLGKMGNNYKLLHIKGRKLMLGTSEDCKHKYKDLLSVGYPSHSSPRHDIENPMATRKEAFDYHSELGGLRPARFALEEFNKIKKTQLQLVRVVGLWMKPQGYHIDPCRCLYVVLMEAVDVDGVTQQYQARVQHCDSTEDMCLEALHRCCLDEDLDDDFFIGMKPTRIKYKRLYHFLDNFYDPIFEKYETDEFL